MLPPPGTAVHEVVLPALTGLVQLSVPPAPALAVTVYCRGALQLALVPPFEPLQPQVKLDAPLVTVVGVPLAHKFAPGAVRVATPLALPQVPFAVCTNVAVTVQAALMAPVV